MMRILLLVAALLIPQLAAAEVFMCTDPTTGQKSFTDKACPKLNKGKKVKVEPTNFGSGVRQPQDKQTWNSDVDSSVAGTSNLKGYSASVERARNVGS